MAAFMIWVAVLVLGIASVGFTLSRLCRSRNAPKQTRVLAILLPLKGIYPGNMVDDLRETCDANINRFISDKSRPINRRLLSELFVEFLRKDSHVLATSIVYLL